MRHASITADCVVCGTAFHPWRHAIGRARFCSRACYKNRLGSNTEEKFWTNVVKGDDCWIYKRVGRRGYGKMLADGRHKRAHRIAWELNKGEIPAGLFVCHTCDNPSCVRPDHLFLGTAADNTADMLAKGRRVAPSTANRPRGERHHNSKITATEARRIKALWAKGGRRQADIGAMFGVSQTAVYHIVHGHSWAHIS